KVRQQNNAKVLREKRKTAAERRAKLRAERAERDKEAAAKARKPESDDQKPKKAGKPADEKSETKDKAALEPAPPKRRVVVYKDVPLSPVEERLGRTLALELNAGGPYEPWSVTLRNGGAEPVRV